MVTLIHNQPINFSSLGPACQRAGVVTRGCPSTQDPSSQATSREDSRSLHVCIRLVR
jgi:hypothetical protein